MKAKVQVLLCRCCTQMPRLLDFARLEKLASETHNVVSVIAVEAACDGKELTAVVQDARLKEVDRAVVMACHKKDVSTAVLRAYRRAGVNEHLVEFVNVREEVVLPHVDDAERAQAKAETKLRAAVDRSTMLAPLEKHTEEMRTKNVVIIGAGVSGQAAAREAAKYGAHTILIEKTGKTLKAPGVVLPKSKLISAKGYGGNFTLTIEAGEKLEELEASAIVVATGGGWSALKGSLAKAVKDSLPLYKFHELMRAGGQVKGPVVFMDTPDPEGKSLRIQDYAWDDTLETAINLKKSQRDLEVFVVFQEMRASGLSEIVYKEAAEIGVRFIRYDRPKVPKVDAHDPAALIVQDVSFGEPVKIKFGTLVFSSIPPNEDNKWIADGLRIPMTPEGAIRRGSIQRWPVTTPRPGIFVCGSALFPKPSKVAEEEGAAAGAMAGEFVSHGKIEYGGIVAQVTPEKCSACLTCVRTCPYEAPYIGAASKAEIRVQACQGCGICVGICPSKAIDLHNFTDDQLAAETRTLLGGEF